MFESPLTILSLFIAYVALHLVGFVRRLLAKPKHEPSPRRRPLADDEDLALEACRIATENVRQCLEERQVLGGGTAHILCAGVRNFREPWARDFSLASFGLLEMGEKRTVREGLQVFFRFQRPDGQLPVKVHSTGVVERYLHSLFDRHQPIQAPLRPRYLTGHRTVSLDGNGLLVVAAAHFALYAGEPEFLAKVETGMMKALEWMGRFAGPDGLLRQGPYTDWADTVARRGVVLYTNVVYWKALELVSVVRLCKATKQLADRVQQAILEHMWLEGEGYLATSPGLDILNSDGNLLAVAWGLVKGTRAQRILDAMDRRKMADPVPTRCTDKPYPGWWIAVECYLAGIPHYHTSVAWMWLGSWHAVALARSGRVEQARQLLRRMDEHVAQDGVVYEVYGPDGHPLRTFWYESEAPLTWNAAMLLYAHRVVASLV